MSTPYPPEGALIKPLMSKILEQNKRAQGVTMKTETDWYEQSKITGRFRRLNNKEKQLVFELRDNPTPAEIALWKMIQKKQVEGFKFRQQHKIGPYIVDFYCHSANLAIEVDGPIHQMRQEYDTNRTAWLNSIGLKVIRFSNEEVLYHAEQVRTRILEELKRQTND